MTTLTITKPQLTEALAQWEAAARRGETLTEEQSRARPVDEAAASNADHLWSMLGGKAQEPVAG